MRKNTPEEAEAKRLENNARLREWRRMLKEHHICRSCKRQDAYTLNGRTYCAECAGKGAEKQRNWREKHPGANAAAVKRSFEKRVAEGRCKYCGDPLPDDGYKSCPTCRARMRKLNAEYRAAKGVNQPRGGNGYCWQCNRRPAQEGFRLCRECRDMKLGILAKINGKPHDNADHVWRRTICRT